MFNFLFLLQHWHLCANDVAEIFVEDDVVLQSASSIADFKVCSPKSRGKFSSHNWGCLESIYLFLWEVRIQNPNPDI